MSNGVDPDQDRRSPVGPDLGPNSLSKLSADYKSCRQQGILYETGTIITWVVVFNKEPMAV